MSGFEIAGIVLGSIPLVISTLENYGAGISTLQRFRKYRRELQSLIRNLETERIKLENVCEKLLIGLVPPSRIEALTSNPMGDLWREEDTLRKIQVRLGKGFKSFEATINHLKTTIDEMARRIDSQKDGMVSGLKRAVFTLSRSQYADLLTEIRESISNLENLTDRNMELEPARRGRSRGKLFVLLRSMSESLYRALGSSLNCACGHNIGLGLESRTTEVFPLDDEDRIMSSTTFKIAFSYTEDPQKRYNLGRNLGQTKRGSCEGDILSWVARLFGSPEQTPGQEERSVFRLIRRILFRDPSRPDAEQHGGHEPEHRIKVGGNQTGIGSYGTILDNFALGVKEYSLSPVRFSDYQDTPCHSVMSLREILEQKDNSIHLPYRDRLKLAVVVSSSILQLHGNPWLPETLTNSDIFFLKKRNYPIYSRPFLLRNSSASAGKGKETSPPFCNPALWSLGVLFD
ncbi:hypothetical protein CEP52_015256 [Fusarium oligoseptatum]|uniref:DUF7580 domain-containing protein n=1 Tax=Fusarium oligoseptatum TaxID=2604345 RepID=A0A428SEW4_9HYPO|nr:hypothetical protein CEP52_015256 [Fusarium oligoseptatum]